MASTHQFKGHLSQAPPTHILCTVSMLLEVKTHTICCPFPLMGSCAPGTLTCSHTHRLLHASIPPHLPPPPPPPPLKDTLELQSKNTKPVAATCLSFPCNDVNKFVVGSEECVVFQGQRHGSKPGIGMHYEGHFGPLTAVSCHKAASGQVSARLLMGCADRLMCNRLIFLTCF